MKLKNKKIWCTVMIVIIVAIDQITKYFAKACLYGKGAKPFIKGVVEFVYAQNTGVAFSMFDGGRWFFVALTAVVLLFCILYMYKGKGQNNLWLFWSLGVIVSGAIGNLIDRIYLGYVIDFINPTFVNFAVFNVADCFVTVGVALLVIYYLRSELAQKKQKEAAAEPAENLDEQKQDEQEQGEHHVQ